MKSINLLAAINAADAEGAVYVTALKINDVIAAEVPQDGTLSEPYQMAGGVPGVTIVSDNLGNAVIDADEWIATTQRGTTKTATIEVYVKDEKGQSPSSGPSTVAVELVGDYFDARPTADASATVAYNDLPDAA